MIENRAPIASMFSFQSYTIAIMIGRNSVNRDRCMTFDILTPESKTTIFFFCERGATRNKALLFVTFSFRLCLITVFYRLCMYID
jgi:hypothetical protein